MVKKIIFLGVILLFIVGFIYRKEIMNLFISAKSLNTSETRVLLKKDPTFNTLLVELQNVGIIDDGIELRKFAIDSEIDTTNFAGGKYVILAQTKFDDLLDAFQKGEDGNGKKEVMVNVIFNACRDVNDISGSIGKCIAADSSELIAYILDPKVLSKYGFTKEQMPALFLPQQYEMPYDTDEEEFVAFMAEKFKAFWNNERKQKMATLGLTSPSKVTTLASIVYSEQGRVKEEWPIIAKLYLNRLNSGQKLQSDPTFKFCWGHELDGVQILRSKHRDIDCSYNTYKINGLPPGPICITPASVIDAVLNPANVDYIYMCAKPDNSGTHNFTASGSQHISNAAVYRKWIKEQKNEE